MSEATPAGSSLMEFVLAQLRASPDLSFQDVKARAEANGWTIYPIMYGRAKALLGLIPTRPRKPRKKAGEDAPSTTAEPEATTRSRRPKSTASTIPDLSNIEGLVASVKEMDAERRRLRQVIDQIADLIDQARE